MMLKTCKLGMPGRIAPAFLFSLAAIAAPIDPAIAQLQPNATVLPPPANRPVPDALELSKLIWSHILAVDHANRSGNYSVLRDISAQGFQINNDAARLAQIFSGLRANRIDLSNALLVPPTYTSAPQLVQADVFRTTGLFQIRPTTIQFDMYFQWEQGRWKLYGIDLQPLQMVSAMPGPAASPPPQPQAQQQQRPTRRR